jgi:hypothetical protein
MKFVCPDSQYRAVAGWSKTVFGGSCGCGDSPADSLDSGGSAFTTVPTENTTTTKNRPAATWCLDNGRIFTSTKQPTPCDGSFSVSKRSNLTRTTGDKLPTITKELREKTGRKWAEWAVRRYRLRTRAKAPLADIFLRCSSNEISYLRIRCAS